MIGALSGGDSLEILVALKNMTTAGFTKIRSEMSATEAAANRSSLSGFSKQAKNVEADAGKAEKGIGGLGSGMLAMAGGPVGVAVIGLGAVAGASLELEKTYEKVEQQETKLSLALKNHGESLNALQPKIEQAINASAEYGYSADDTRAAITQLTEANLSFSQIQSALPHIMDLARAKNIDLATAADSYTKAVFGSAKALKGYGIILPAVSASAADVQKATDKLTAAEKAAALAHEELTVVEDKLKTKHTLTAAEALTLQRAHDKVTTADATLKKAHDAVTLAAQGGVNVGQRLTLVNAGLTKAIGDQRAAVTPMQVAQANLNNAWERMSTAVGPGLQDMFARLVNGIGKFINMIMDAIGWLGNLANKVGEVSNAIGNSPIGKLAGGAGDVASNIGGAIGGAEQSLLGALPHFASGGVVSRPTLLMAGEGGEREYIIPESKMAGSSSSHLHIHFHTVFPPTPQMARDLADAIEPELGRRFNRKSTSLGYGMGG